MSSTNGNHGYRTPVELQTPPHADEVEQTFMNDMSSILQRQSQMQAERMAALMESQNKLDAHMVAAAKVADQFLRMYTNTLVRVRMQTEANESLVKELQEDYANSLSGITQFLTKAGRPQ